MHTAKDEKNKNYYLEGMKVLFIGREISIILKIFLLHIKIFYQKKEEHIQTLFNEIKVLKN